MVLDKPLAEYIVPVGQRLEATSQSTKSQKQEMLGVLASAAESEARVLILNEKYLSYSIDPSTLVLIDCLHRIVELSQDLSNRITQLDAARAQEREYVLSTCSDMNHQ